MWRAVQGPFSWRVGLWAQAHSDPAGEESKVHLELAPTFPLPSPPVVLQKSWYQLFEGVN